jgi:WbqC-like protein family
LAVSSSLRRVGIIQSSYIPWRGYFDFIRSVDLFVFYDDVQYSKGSWRNRNRVKTREGVKWITVPTSASIALAIDETPIDNTHDWRARHGAQLEAALGPGKYFEDAMRIWKEGARGDAKSISELNVRLVRGVCEYLEIRTPFTQSRGYAPNGSKSARLIDLLGKLGATTYLSGPAAKGYLEEDLFRANGIQLEYKSYDYESYPQLWGPFEGAVTILDLIANMGPEARNFLSSKTPNLVAEPIAHQ